MFCVLTSHHVDLQAIAVFYDCVSVIQMWKDFSWGLSLPWNYLKLRTQILSTPYFKKESKLGPDTPSEETSKSLTITASDRNSELANKEGNFAKHWSRSDWLIGKVATFLSPLKGK